MSLRHIAVPGAIALCLLAGACSSSSSGGGSPSTSASTPAPRTSSSSSTPSSTSPDSTSAGNGAPSRAALAGVVVQRSDLPAGFTGKAADPEDNNDRQTDAKLASCVGSATILNQNRLANVQSDDFTKGTLTVSSDASSYSSQADVAKQVAVLHSPKIQPCVNTVLRQQLKTTIKADGGSITGVAITFTKGSDGGPSNLVGRAEGHIGLKVQGKTAVLYLYIAFITGRQLTGTVSGIAVGRPGSDAVIAAAVAAYAKRAANV